MSQSTAGWSPQDRQAAAAVTSHHAQLADDVDQRAQALISAVEAAWPADPAAEQARRDLLNYLQTELMPHALAEEGTLYQAAARRAEGTLLVDGMLDEHRRIVALIEELESAASPLRAAAAARAITAILATHLAKENDLVVPLVAGAPDVSLAELLAGMHELLGDAHGGEGEQAGDCGCGGCGCGGDDAGATAQPASTLTIDPRLNVCDLSPKERHATVFAALDQIAPGGALVLVAPHAPRPLLAQIEERYAGQFQVQWLESGPEVWQLRLQRGAGVTSRALS